MTKIRYILLICLYTSVAFGQTRPLDSLRQKVEAAIQRQDRRAEADALEALAHVEADQGSIYEALHHVERAIALYHALGEKAEAFKSYTTLITVHQQLHNGAKILEYALPALQYSEEKRDTQLMLLMKNAVGVGYSQLGKRSAASAMYLECIDLEKAMGQSTTYACVNASSSFIEAGDYAKGLVYAQQSIRQAVAERDTFVLAIAYICEAYALANLGDVPRAEAAIGHLEQLMPALPEAVIDRDLAAVKHLTLAAKGDYRGAYRQFQQFYQIDSTLSSGQRNAQFAALEATYRTKEKEIENAQLSARLTRQRVWLAGIAGVMLLLGGAILFQRRHWQTQSKLLAAEKELAEAGRLRALEEKALYERELNDFTNLLVEKNRAIDTLQSDLQQQKAALAERDSLAISEQLVQQIILTEADWRNFRQKFERVHAGFFEKMAQEVSDVTDAELRLAALTKLQLSNDEIAAMLGISPESVTKTRYRLRKKLGDRDLAGVVRGI